MTLSVESYEPVVRHAADNLRSSLVSSGCTRRVVVAVAPEKNPLTARLTVGVDEIRVTGATPREAAQACYRLEDELRACGDVSRLRLGTRTYTRLFSPRMVHSGRALDRFPDDHLDEIARAGMDAILVYVTEPPDMTREGRSDLNALVARAAVRGIDVYAYLDRWGQPIEKHPLDPGAEAYYDALVGSIVKNAPGLKGMVLVGESCAFPSRDPDVRGYAWAPSPIRRDPAHPLKGCNGFYPVSDWKEFLELVTKVTRKYNPDFDVVFWTYNWSRAPEADRLAMLERIPTNVTLHVTFEMGDKPVEKMGVMTRVDDYSVSIPGPSPTFAGEAAVAARRGIRLSSMTNTGGRTWDFGGLPFEPFPYRWLERFAAVRAARADYGLVALMDGHHYGFAPSFVSELAKCAFTEETTPADLDACLRASAASRFGAANAETVLAAWKDWSDALGWHAARDFDQYGVLRVGPTYPLTFYGERLPDAPKCLGKDGCWKYVWQTAGIKWGKIEKHEIAPYLAMAERERTLFRRGNERLRGILDRVPAGLRATAERELGYGLYCEHTLTTSCNVKRWWIEGLKTPRDAAALLRIVDDEIANVTAALPVVTADSHLGWEPSMRYVTSPGCLRWKLDQLARQRKEFAAEALRQKERTHERN